MEGCSGLRVATHTGGTILDLESSESDDLDFLIFLHACGDGGKDCVEGFFRGTLGGVVSEGFLNGFYKFCFVHGRSGFAKLGTVLQDKS